MSMKDILSRLDQINESSTMKSAAKKSTGPKFPGYWKGTDPASQAKNKMVGGGAEESIIRDLEKALVENPRSNAHQLMREFTEFKEDEYGAYQPPAGAANQGDTHTSSPIGSGTNEGEEEALAYAAKAHAGQKRSGGDPYISHPVRVANHIRQFKQSHNLEALISAAYLHDTIEDTDTTQEILHDLFGGLVASLVMELTSDPEEIKRVGKANYLAHKMAAMSSYALVIKLADRLDNVKDITTARTPQWRAKYAAETNHILDFIERNRALSGTHKKLISMIRAKVAELDQPALSEARIHTPKTVDVYYRPNTTSDKARIIAKSIPYTTLELLIRAMTKKFGTRPEDFEWTSVDEPYGHRLGEEQLAEYGSVGTTGAASQAPQGTSAQNPDPAAQQAKQDQAQIQKSTNNLAPTLNSQGAAQPLNKVKFQDVMNKLDTRSNQELPAQDMKQLGPLAVAASKAMQNPQTAAQLKQVISKADSMDQQKELKVKQAQQQTGTNAPAGAQTPQSPQPGQQNQGQPK